MLTTGRLGSKHLTPQKQRQMIEGHGQAVAVFPVLQCPCLLADQQFNPICPACHGTGRYYRPELAYATTLLLVRETAVRTFQDPGTWFPGSIQASVLPGIRLCERDKVRLMDIKDVFADEVLTRGLDETLRFHAGVELQVVADLQQVYRKDVDYALHTPATVAWVPGGQSPVFGSQYSVKYDAFPEYLVVNDQPRLRVEHHVPQSQVVVLCRLDHLTEE